MSAELITKFELETPEVDKEATMIKEVSAVNFRQNLGKMLNQVQYCNDSIVISKNGKPVAALVDAEMFARIRRIREQHR